MFAFVVFVFVFQY